MDLNLLGSLDVLLEECNVTRAAQRLGMSQPALSAQLARLRGILGDPLLIPSETGRGMIPTARALALRDPLRAALKDLETAIRKPADFDPHGDERTFTIAASDLATMVVGFPLVERLRELSAGAVRICFRSLPSDITAPGLLERGEADLVIGAGQRLLASLKARKLFEERYVMIQSKQHSRGAGPIDLETYCRLDHALVSPIEGDLRGFIDDQLEAIGHRRNTVLSVQQFLLAPMIVERTELICALPERFALRFTDRVDVFELPLPLPTFSMFAAWHPRNQNDAGHVWLREQLAQLAGRAARAKDCAPLDDIPLLP